MRRVVVSWTAIVGVLLFATVGSAADSAAKQYLGQWTGSWEGGGGNGRFEMTLELAGDQLTGGVSVGTDGGDYTAKFATVAIDGNKLTAKYEYPLDTQGEVVLNASFDNNQATGTWVLQPKGQDAPLANGTWTVKKK